MLKKSSGGGDRSNEASNSAAASSASREVSPKRKKKSGLGAAAKSAMFGAGKPYISEYAASKGTIMVTDAETGMPLILNTLTAYDRAMERGDAFHRGGESTSSVVHAMPKLSEDPVKSAALQMFVEAQRQALTVSVEAEAVAEQARQEAMLAEGMEWRRVHLRREHAIERVEAYAKLEKTRVAQEATLLLKARQLGLL